MHQLRERKLLSWCINIFTTSEVQRYFFNHIETKTMNKIEMKTPISYYGGKQQLLSTILPLIPEHETYTEAFFGGGAVFWAKKPAKHEVINDLNAHVINFYKVLKKRFNELKNAIETSTHSRVEYKRAMVIYDVPHLFNEIQRAWAFWYATNLGFSKIIGSFAFDKNRGKYASFLQNKIEAFEDVYSERLSQVEIEHNEACYVVELYDNPAAFHYVDPLYVGSDMGHYAGYTQEDFNRLLGTLAKVKGKFLLSSFPNDELAKYVKKHGWWQKEIVMFKSASSKAGSKKTEVLTGNYEI